jgi:hypothetical protein
MKSKKINIVDLIDPKPRKIVEFLVDKTKLSGFEVDMQLLSSVPPFVKKMLSLRQELFNIQVDLHAYVLPKSSNGVYFVDVPDSVIGELYENNKVNKTSRKCLILVIKIDDKGKFIDHMLYHANIKLETKKQVIELLTKTFKDKFVWNGSTGKTMFIN